ncbi:MAG: alpha/beta hydrolase [Eubacterium sp.]|nr:alpha/beta hydrolase [Eubacterium sp.]
MNVTMKTKMADILELPEFRNREYMLNPFMGDIFMEVLGDRHEELSNGRSYTDFSLEEMEAFIPSRTIPSIKEGWEYLVEKSEEKRLIYDYWSEDAKKSDSSKEKTGLMAFVVPGCRKFVMICPGGGYTNVCSITEGFPIAKQFNELGYSAFVLQYRTNEAAGYPNPMDDLAEALKYVFSNADTFDVDVNDYAVAGFSAGGHLAASFGTESLGYKKYDLPKPAALILGYPVITMTDLTHGGSRDKLLGVDFREEDVQEYSIEKQVTECYPETFIWYCEADALVSKENSEMLVEQIEKYGIEYECEVYEGDAHGWGTGDGTPAAGWIARAVRFWEQHWKYN